jgi:UDP-N-acetylglucosamine 4-epimerase
MLRDKRVLVTGGAGFIGSNLVESLLKSGNSVVCLDNFSTGKRENLIKFAEDPNFRLIEGDIRNYNDFKEYKLNGKNPSHSRCSL